MQCNVFFNFSQISQLKCYIKITLFFQTENYINEYLASSDHPLTPEQVWRNTSDNTSDHHDTINTENNRTSGTLSPANRPAEGVQDPRNGSNQQDSGNVNNSSSATEASVLPEGNSNTFIFRIIAIHYFQLIVKICI